MIPVHLLKELVALMPANTLLVCEVPSTALLPTGEKYRIRKPEFDGHCAVGSFDCSTDGGKTWVGAKVASPNMNMGAFPWYGYENWHFEVFVDVPNKSK